MCTFNYRIIMFYRGAFLTGGYPLYATQSAFYNNVLYHVVHQNKFYLILSYLILSYRGHRIMNNSGGFPTNQQARLQENKQFFCGRF